MKDQDKPRPKASSKARYSALRKLASLTTEGTQAPADLSGDDLLRHELAMARGREALERAERIMRARTERAPSANRPLSQLGETKERKVAKHVKVGVNRKAKDLKGFDGLPDKKPHDHSEFIYPAKLTPRQRDCYSLRFEYDLGPTEIARRLGLTHHSTVQYHIARANAKIDGARKMGKEAKRRAIHNPTP